MDLLVVKDYPKMPPRHHDGSAAATIDIKEQRPNLFLNQEKVDNSMNTFRMMIMVRLVKKQILTVLYL